ncbi:MAG: hypothetical protein BWK73_09175 [Thiothrix lacustris]|uniref:Replication protein n=1 Tax=Thiothrix lacustris TaxID=525917 RepID=A0A1Y1QV63_9GAMM|nr:MAG: hypothetical protein BWK73_09175 [Thiothrix lacustris]
MKGMKNKISSIEQYKPVVRTTVKRCAVNTVPVAKNVLSGKISFTAMGMMAYILAQPKGWEMDVDTLVAATADCERPISRGLAYKIILELRNAGFISMNRDGLNGVFYQISDMPLDFNEVQSLKGKE